ncbi:MAG TPA: rod-binding protein [Steroidobacteraceae bacterium]|jgi:flagellar protein FlgJ
MSAPFKLDASIATTLPQVQDPAVSAANTDDGMTPQYRAKVKDAAEKFEGFFISQMLKQMREGTRELADEDSVYKDSVNQDMLDMADTTMADSLAGQHAFGIADAILRQLLPPAATAPQAAGFKNLPAPVATSDGNP